MWHCSQLPQSFCSRYIEVITLTEIVLQMGILLPTCTGGGIARAAGGSTAQGRALCSLRSPSSLLPCPSENQPAADATHSSQDRDKGQRGTLPPRGEFLLKLGASFRLSGMGFCGKV